MVCQHDRVSARTGWCGVSMTGSVLGQDGVVSGSVLGQDGVVLA